MADAPLTDEEAAAAEARPVHLTPAELAVILRFLEMVRLRGDCAGDHRWSTFRRTSFEGTPLPDFAACSCGAIRVP